MNTKHQLALRRAREILLSIDRDTLINDLLDTEYDETEQTVDEFFDNMSNFDTCQLFNLDRYDEADEPETESDFNLAYSAIPYAIIRQNLDCDINFVYGNHQHIQSSITVFESKKHIYLDFNFLNGRNQRVYSSSFDDDDSYELLVA